MDSHTCCKRGGGGQPYAVSGGRGWTGCKRGGEGGQPYVVSGGGGWTAIRCKPCQLVC